MLTAFENQSLLTFTPTELFLRMKKKLEENVTPPELSLLKQTLLTKIALQENAQLNQESAASFKEVKRSVLLMNALRKKYGQKMEEKGTKAIIEEIIAYAQSKLNCDTSSEKSRSFDANDPFDTRIVKTVLRALLDTAPDNSEHPNYFLAEAPRLFGFDQTFHAQEMLSLFWLAASDSDIEADIEKEKANLAEKDLIIRVLAEARRANNDETFQVGKEDKTDKLSCGPGIITRLGNAFNHNLTLRVIKEKLVSFIEDFPAKFDAFLIHRFKALDPQNQWQSLLAYLQRVNEEAVTFRDLENFFHSFLSEKVMVTFLENLQAEYEPFGEDLFKYTMVIFFEQWLKNKNKMSLAVYTRLETIAKESLVLLVHQRTLAAFSLQTIKPQMEKLESLFLQMTAFKRSLYSHADINFRVLSDIHAQYKIAYHAFFDVLSEIKATTKADFQHNLAEDEALYFQITGKKEHFSSSPLQSLNWLPAEILPFLTKMQGLHQEMMETQFDRILHLNEYEMQDEALQPMIVLNFQGQLLSHDKTSLVKARLYRHVGMSEKLGLKDIENFLSINSYIEIRSASTDKVRIFFTNINDLSCAAYDMPALEFERLVQEERTYQQNIAKKVTNSQMHDLSSQFNNLQIRKVRTH